MKRKHRIVRRQPTTPELLENLQRFIESKFYQGNPVSFAKDRPRLLKWVVLKLAVYLEDRGVTIPADRYLAIVRDSILMEAVRFGRTDEIKYPPAWLGRVVDLHLDNHGEEYYEEGKALRSQVQNAILIARRSVQAAPDPVHELAAASRLLRRQKPAKFRPGNGQLTML